ncbi:MAG: hypothetical protein FWF80_05465 [Defluviitaleaceae bacterium]|nr:hypothetical protein [Defluviitaleaceae bacterium]
MRLWEFEGKRIKITDVDGQVFIGACDYYTSELDDPNGVASLSLAPDGEDDITIGFTADEIAGIEIIPDAMPVMAEAV